MVVAQLAETYGGSTIDEYVLFFAILTVGAVVGRAASFLLERHLMRTATTTETDFDDVIIRSLGGPIALLGVVVAAHFGRGVLSPTDEAEMILDAVVEVPLIVALAWVTIRLTDGLINRYIGSYAEQTESRLDDELVPIVSRMTNIAIISISGLVILDSIGYDVTAIIASLGIGGVALAFAARKTLSDVFGGAHILSTKPFLVDDIIEVNDYAGTVEEIGLRSTILRDFDGRLVTIPNSTIADSVITNVSSEATRRAVYTLRLPYETDTEQMDRGLELLEDTVNGIDGVKAEQTCVHFWEYGESAMAVRLEYHIAAIDRWRDVRDAVNRAIQTEFEAAGLEMALPTRSIRMHDGPARSSDHREA
jgi:MscS family membrane protein